MAARVECPGNRLFVKQIVLINQHNKSFKMKRLTFTPTEFKLFQKLANHMQIIFMYTVSQGLVIVEASAYELEGLGY